jgi:hypothetical protein
MAASVVHADNAVEMFDSTTWNSLQHSLSRPAAVVFTATYCESCPQVLAKLHTELADHTGSDESLIAVVIDGAEDLSAVQAEHYSAHRVFVFDGDEVALRYGVDPKWHGETPLVALLPKHGKPVMVAGMPNAKELASWLRQ